MSDARILNPELMNEFEMIQVMDRLQERGIKYYTMQPGNNCIWVSYNLVNCYYIFRGGKIVDIQYD
jgi:hypothetical protein